jgi:ferredoxin
MRDERRPRGPSRARTPVTGRAQASFYDNVVPYIITEPCIGVKDGSCVDVCPVDCIHGDEAHSQLYIDPEVCIDCGACVSACPVEAIYADADVPAKWEHFKEINAAYYSR